MIRGRKRPLVCGVVGGGGSVKKQSVVRGESERDRGEESRMPK